MTTSNQCEHVFLVQSPMQFYLAEAVVKALQLNVELVLVLVRRGMELFANHTDLRVVSLNTYEGVYSRNALLSIRQNRIRLKNFKAEIESKISDSYVLYGPSFDQWYQFRLARRATSVYVLEDGFASYGSTQDIIRHFTERRRSYFERLRFDLKFWAFHNMRYPWRRKQNIEFILNAERYFTVTSDAFPDVNSGKKYVLPNVFPAYEHPPIENVRYVLATSWLVEAKYLSLTDYLFVIECVLDQIITEGVTTLHVKLHPVQTMPGAAACNYENWFKNYSPALQVVLLPTSLSIERLAVTEDFTLVTALSSLALYVKIYDRKVRSYYSRLLPYATGVADAARDKPKALIRKYYSNKI